MASIIGITGGNDGFSLREKNPLQNVDRFLTAKNIQMVEGPHILRSLLNIIDVFINPKGKGETMEGDRPVQLQLGQHWTFCIRRYRIFAEYYLQYKKGNNLSGSRMKCLVGKSESSMSVRVQNLLQKRLLVYRAFRTDCHVLRRRWRGRKRKIINPNIAAATAWSRYHSSYTKRCFRL